MIEFCCRSTLAERPKNVWLYGRFLLAAYHFFNAFGLIFNVRRHSMARKQAMRLAESDGLGRCACLLGAAVCKHDRERQKAIHILKLFRGTQRTVALCAPAAGWWRASEVMYERGER